MPVCLDSCRWYPCFVPKVSPQPSQRHRLLSRSMSCVAAHAHAASAVSCSELQLGQTKPLRGGSPMEWSASCRRTLQRSMVPERLNLHLVHGFAQPSKRHFTCGEAARGGVGLRWRRGDRHEARCAPRRALRGGAGPSAQAASEGGGYSTTRGASLPLRTSRRGSSPGWARSMCSKIPSAVSRN